MGYYLKKKSLISLIVSFGPKNFKRPSVTINRMLCSSWNVRISVKKNLSRPVSGFKVALKMVILGNILETISKEFLSIGNVVVSISNI